MNFVLQIASNNFTIFCSAFFVVVLFRPIVPLLSLSPTVPFFSHPISVFTSSNFEFAAIVDKQKRMREWNRANEKSKENQGKNKPKKGNLFIEVLQHDLILNGTERNNNKKQQQNLWKSVFYGFLFASTAAPNIHLYCEKLCSWTLVSIWPRAPILIQWRFFPYLCTFFSSSLHSNSWFALVQFEVMCFWNWTT